MHDLNLANSPSALSLLAKAAVSVIVSGKTIVIEITDLWNGPPHNIDEGIQTAPYKQCHKNRGSLLLVDTCGKMVLTHYTSLESLQIGGNKCEMVQLTAECRERRDDSLPREWKCHRHLAIVVLVEVEKARAGHCEQCHLHVNGCVSQNVDNLR
jgi:hypothetical protein